MNPYIQAAFPELDESDVSIELLHIDDIYDNIDNDNYSKEECQHDISYLIQNRLIRQRIVDDEYVYERVPGTKWIHTLNPSLQLTSRQRAILLTLMDDPKTLSFIYNTQKGKTEYIVNTVKDLATIETKKIVTFIVLLNDQTLADQSITSILTAIGRPFEGKELPNGIFPLMSQYKVNEREIRTYIDAYKYDISNEYPMPIIFSLDNPTQRDKVTNVINRINEIYTSGQQRLINQHVTHEPKQLCVSMLFDECDSTYPSHRTISLGLIQTDVTLHTLHFITATDGTMIDDYDEFRHALCISQPENENEEHYRSIHHSSSVVKHIEPCNVRLMPYNVILQNTNHFDQEVQTVGGQHIKRKTIINGSKNGVDHRLFALHMVGLSYNVMTFNMMGVTLYRPGNTIIRISTKRRRLNEILYYMYTVFRLEHAPLFIIGCRKVDRGLGFHYAPRSHISITKKTVDYGYGPVEFDGVSGLIFTDMILGKVDNISTAAQKSGRLDGIIGQCPQCPVCLTWWTDELTSSNVISHKTIVDEMHRLPGGIYSTFQAKNTAVDNINSRVNPDTNVNNNDPEVDPNTYRIYDDEDTLRKACEIMGYQYRRVVNNPTTGFKETSLNNVSHVASLDEAVSKVPTAYGTNNGITTWRTYYPCYVDVTNNQTLRFVMIIRPGTTSDKLNQCDTECRNILYSRGNLTN